MIAYCTLACCCVAIALFLAIAVKKSSHQMDTLYHVDIIKIEQNPSGLYHTLVMGCIEIDVNHVRPVSNVVSSVNVCHRRLLVPSEQKFTTSLYIIR